MSEATWAKIKRLFKRYLLSSLVTFLTFFLAALALSLKDVDIDALLVAGYAGAASVVGRLIIKALLESIISLMVALVTKINKNKLG